MEKFTKWADKSGVNPFVPCKPVLPKSITTRVFYVGYLIIVASMKITVAILLTIIQGIIRVLLSSVPLIVLAVAAIFSGTVQSPVIKTVLIAAGLTSLLPYIGLPSWALNLVLMRLFVRILSPLTLCLLGVYFKLEYANFRRLGIDYKGMDPNTLSSLYDLVGGNIVIFNLTNVLEIIYLDALFHPVYVFPYKVQDTYLCVEAGFFRALQISAYGTGGVPPADVKPISDILRSSMKKNRALVLFVEGVRTNGDGVLNFPVQIFEPLVATGHAVAPPIHMAAFVYPPPSTFSPATPVGSPFMKIFWLSGIAGITFRNTFIVNVYSVPASLLPQLHGNSSADHLLITGTTKMMTNINKSGQQLSTWVGQIRDIFSQVVKKNKVMLGIDDMNSFREYYDLLMKGDIDAAKAIADSKKKI